MYMGLCKDSINKLIKKDGDLYSWLLEDACRDYDFLISIKDHGYLSKDKIINHLKSQIKKSKKNVSTYTKYLDDPILQCNIRHSFEERKKRLTKILKEDTDKYNFYKKKLEEISQKNSSVRNSMLHKILSDTERDLEEMIDSLDTSIKYTEYHLNIPFNEYKEDFINKIKEERQRNLDSEVHNLKLSIRRLQDYLDYTKEVDNIFGNKGE